MFWVDYKGWPLEGATGPSMKCTNCGNTAERCVYVLPRGLQLGFIFFKKPLVGRRKYYLACSVCGYMCKELTKEQANAMKGTGR